jgi:hypothetical protein
LPNELEDLIFSLVFECCHPPLNCSNNIVYDDAEKAEAFNTFFSSQSNIDDTDKIGSKEIGR